MISLSAKFYAAAHRLAAERALDAGRQFSLLLKANFNPSQPRVPAGSADGGRWTDGSGGGNSGGRLVHIGGRESTPPCRSLSGGRV